MAASILSFPPRSSGPALSLEQPGAPRKVSLEDGYTRLADALVETLASTKLGGREFRLLMVVIRKTYGYGKSEDWISLSQMADMTGIDKANCSRLVDSLVGRRILNCRKRGHDRVMGINPDVTQWQGEKPKKKEVVKNDNQVVKNDNKYCRKRQQTRENDNHNKQINNKHILKDNVPAASQPETADVDQPVLVSPDQPVDQPIDQPAGQLAEPIAERRVAKEPDSKPKSRKRTLTFDPADREFAEYMLTQIEGVNGSQGKTNLDQWANDIRLMRTQDGHTPEQISQLFQFANTHPINSGGFTWSAVIRSPAKLRKKWGDLMAQYRTQQRFNASPITSGTNHHENRSATGQPHHHTHDHTHQTREDYLNDISWMPEHLL